VDVTGAGDVFGGAFAATLAQSGDPLRAVLMGSVAASFAIEGYGALYALDPPREQVQERLETLAERSGLD
jgi:sugar/nucleoside kinase (ribokinase family)